MIKIIAINSKFIHINSAVWYLHYSLKTNNINSSVESYSINDQYDNVLRGVLTSNPNIVCFSSYIWNIEYILKLVNDIKNINSNIKIILGGPEVSFDSEQVLKNNAIDLIIRGEGENVISQIIKGDTSYGCAFIKDGKYIDNGYAIVKDLNDIPFIFTEEVLGVEKNKIMYYESSRGCPYNCIYCLSSTLNGVRYLDIERVFKELLILSQSDIKQIKFVDRTFNLNEKRSVAILKYINGLKCDINFHLEIYPASLSQKTMECLLEMKKGRVQIEAGIQSTNKKTLDYSKRFQDSTKALNNIKKIIVNGNIHVHLDLIAGLPYEDKSLFIKSFNETIETRPHMLQLGFLKLLRGTKAREIEGYVAQNLAPYEILKTPWLSFNDMSEIKLVEYTLNMFYNTNKFIKIMKYMLDRSENAYMLFLNIAKYINVQYEKDHKLSEFDKYEILFKISDEEKIIKELLRFDYMATHKSKSMPYFLNDEDKIKDKIFKYFMKQNMNAKTMYKNTNISIFHFKQETTYLFDYREVNRVTKVFKYKKIKL